MFQSVKRVVSLLCVQEELEQLQEFEDVLEALEEKLELQQQVRLRPLRLFR